MKISKKFTSLLTLLIIPGILFMPEVKSPVLMGILVCCCLIGGVSLGILLGGLGRNDVESSEKKMNRLALIEIYESQLSKSGNFMSIVLTEAIRKLKEIPKVDTKKVENWVVKLEKTYMNF